MAYATRSELRLYYEQAGAGDPPLLFVHGWCCDHTFFAPQFEYFKSSHAVTALDLRGCGNSDRPADGYDIPTLADDIAWFCEEVAIVKPVVVGHSLGGMIAIEVAARHPGLPYAVVGTDPGPVDMLPEVRQEFEQFDADMAGPRSESARRAWVEDTVGDTADEELRRFIVETMCAAPLNVAAAVIRGVIEWDGVAALSACNVPLLVLRREAGGSNTDERLRRYKPDLQFGITVGAGHFHQLEVPEQVNAMIRRFLQLVA